MQPPPPRFLLHRLQLDFHQHHSAITRSSRAAQIKFPLAGNEKRRAQERGLEKSRWKDRWKLTARVESGSRAEPAVSSAG